MEFLLLTTQLKIFFSSLFFVLFIHCISIHYEQINTIMFGDTNAIVNLLGKKSREIKVQWGRIIFSLFSINQYLTGIRKSRFEKAILKNKIVK